MKVRFTSLMVKERNITAKATGKAYTFREQEALVEFPNGERRVIAVSLEKDQSAYSLGEWLVGDGSFVVDRNNKLAVGRLALTPAVASVGNVKTA
ncbi:MAG TPA: single-stranded DNA-binding protein [Steroidobacteraceae bacterium]|nr:single-stranded DNA-binding protein [Steroidobacteraceae bacterium]